MSTNLVLQISPELISVRSNIGVNRHADEALVDSIRELGILQPLLVTKGEGFGYDLVAGHRRFDAAKQLGLEAVPALVMLGLSADDGRLLASQIVENTVRSDLSAMEEVEAYEQLLLHLDVEEAARLVAKPVEQIERISTLAASSAVRSQLEDGLTLFQATDLAELEKDEFVSPEAFDHLMAGIKGSPNRTDELILRARRTAEANRVAAAKVAELEAEGLTVLHGEGAPKSWECFDEKFMKVSHLLGADGQEMTVEEHGSCPGHAVLVEHYLWDRQIDLTYVCQGYKEHGHTLLSEKSKGASDPASSARAELVARASKRWRLESQDAASARRRHVINLLSASKLPASFSRIFLVAMRHYMTDSVLELLPGSATSVDDWIMGSDERALRAVAGAAFLSVEACLQSKLMPNDLERSYIQALIATGYEPTQLEDAISAETFVLPSDRSDEELASE